MRRCRVRWSMLTVVATCLMTVAPAMVQAVDTSDTRLLASPAITEGKIAFVYGDDIWVAGADETRARQLTSHPGQERSPYFAPDGKHIAFTAGYDGNVDVTSEPKGGLPMSTYPIRRALATLTSSATSSRKQTGKDPQLDRLIDLVIEALAKNPPPEAPQRPSFPVRVQPGSDVRAK